MQSDLLQEKDKLRHKIFALLKGFSFEERKQKSVRVHAQLLSWKKLENFQTIGLYAATALEVETFPLFEALQERKKRVALPRVNKQSQTLDFYWIEHWQTLQESAWGIFEPPESATRRASINQIELLLVPGIAFDFKGWRLGRGKGFYDRILQDFKGKSLGVAWNEQFVDSVPHDFKDQPVQGLVTEDFLIHPHPHLSNGARP